MQSSDPAKRLNPVFKKELSGPVLITGELRDKVRCRFHLLRSVFQCNADPGSHEAEIGYWIGVPYWGNGYAPEAVRALLKRAFGELGMEKVWCGYYDGNEQSRAVQEKCGFVYDHTDYHAFNEELHEERVEHFSVLTKSRYETL